VSAHWTDRDAVVLVGENPYGSLYLENADARSTYASVWTVATSPAGPGHVFLLASDLTDGEHIICADNISLARWLQREILGALSHPKFLDTSAPIHAASFHRIAKLPWYFTEQIRRGDDQFEVTWYDFLPTYSGRSSGPEHKPYHHAACYLPAQGMRVTLNGREAVGVPRSYDRDGWQATSCSVTLAESWTRGPGEFPPL
jgi:hypothetical protein